jgi:cysteine desulfuration protein SufE
MPITDTIQQVLDDLGAFGDPLDRLEYLVDRARAQPPLAPEEKNEANRIEGCMAQLWLVGAVEDGHCRFRCDSDSMVVKSVASLLCELYDGATPREVVEHPPDFLATAGVTSHLSANRRNALTQVWKKIRGLAEAHLHA